MAATLVVAVGCAPEPGSRSAATESIAEIRSDAGPLTTRFPALGTPAAVTWVTWKSASGGVPGPTTYWIDAVVTLTPQTTAALIAEHRPAPNGKTPSVRNELDAAVPPGPFLTGAALDAAFSTSGWASAAHLDRERNQLVLKSFDD